jgi:hypothetical protein
VGGAIVGELDGTTDLVGLVTVGGRFEGTLFLLGALETVGERVVTDGWADLVGTDVLVGEELTVGKALAVGPSEDNKLLGGTLILGVAEGILVRPELLGRGLVVGVRDLRGNDES